MRRVRVIPSLLVRNGGLVKSVKFKDHKYVGDPINAVRLFNDMEVDEIMVLDISATPAGRGPDMDKIREFASEAFMPMAYGGGITRLDQIRELITLGVEKVVLNTSASADSGLVGEAAKYVGSQSIVVSLDVKRNLFGKYTVMSHAGTKSVGSDPVTMARRMESAGAGEILLMAMDRDGTYKGYDTDLIHAVSDAVRIPVIAIGGCSGIPDMVKAVKSGASAVAAGSLFVFQGPHRAVLINYPAQEELRSALFGNIP